MNDREDELVSKLSAIVAQECGVPPATVKQIRIAAALHDIGKRQIPHTILLKPGPLTPDEFEIMKTHTTLGAKMVSGNGGALNDLIKTVCLYHHEHWDGVGGYWGKCASDLPLAVPIISLCDVLVALISVRVYKKSWPPEDALAYIQSKSGTQFDPALVDAFIWLVLHDSRVKKLFSS